MRTNIVIDDTLMANAMKAAGTRTKRDTVKAGLETLVRLKSQESIRALRGIGWSGDLNAMRTD